MTEPTVSVCFHDGQFTLPERFKDHPPDRLASTPGDNLIELAGRVCYDSVTSAAGRPTPAYHEHLLGTKHFSVHAHIVETFEVAWPDPDADFSFEVLAALHCRPGVWVTRVGSRAVRFAASLRALLEWPAHGPECDADDEPFVRHAAALVGGCAVEAVRPLYPLALKAVPEHHGYPAESRACMAIEFKRVTARGAKERWCSLYLAGVSRDLLQELVRHHWQANPSVRSTRYCDEVGCVFVDHPALTPEVKAVAEEARSASHRAYSNVFTMLTQAHGVDKKTARGAARSYLLGATETQIVFSLSLFQARHLLALRMDGTTGSVDPEIRRLAVKMCGVLKTVWPDLEG